MADSVLTAENMFTASGTEVIPSVAIDRIIAQRNEGIALFMQGMAHLENARRLLLDASGENFLYGFEDTVTAAVRRGDQTEETRKNISRLADRKIWDRLMTDTGMYTFMSSCQRDEWNRQLQSESCPEITLDNVLATFRHLNAGKVDTFEKGVIDVFRQLSWDYKTNNPSRHLIIPVWLNWMIWHALSGCWMVVMFLIFVNLTVPVLVILYAVKTISGSCTKGNIVRSVPSLKERYTSCSSVRIWLTA